MNERNAKTGRCCLIDEIFPANNAISHQLPLGCHVLCTRALLSPAKYYLAARQSFRKWTFSDTVYISPDYGRETGVMRQAELP